MIQFSLEDPYEMEEKLLNQQISQKVALLNDFQELTSSEKYTILSEISELTQKYTGLLYPNMVVLF